jgi:PTH1 family peptidyl-tRNA hydrolase
VRLPWRRGDRASSLDLLVVGLGNPGREYAGHRHNVGWMVVEELARRHGASWKGKFNGQLAELRLDGNRVALLKPETFMNESGQSVGAAARFYKLEPDAVLVVHDEIDLDRGRLQARKGGGLAGHNGLRSVAAHLKTPEFLRLRVGVGRPGRGDPRKPADYVLSNFEPEDDREGIVARAAEAVETLDAEGLERAQARYN